MIANAAPELAAKLPSTDKLLGWSETVTHSVIAAATAIALALALHFAMVKLLGRMARNSVTRTDDLVYSALRVPLLWAMIAVAISVASESDGTVKRIWDVAGRFIEPALMGWLLYAFVQGFAAALQQRAEVQDDEKSARSRQTRIAIFSRTISYLIIFVAIALVLFEIPAVRSVGTTLLASAGLATMAIAAAAQPALKSFIAGMQIAMTEPIRIGDYVVIDGESGRVEDIRASYVVVRTGDERRIILPTSKFLDGSFQNWSRAEGGLTGSVVLPVTPKSDIPAIRSAYEGLLAANADWDKRTGSLQVSEIHVGSIELKLVMSAAGPSALSSLRTAMREAMLQWLRDNMPDALCTEI